MLSQGEWKREQDDRDDARRQWLEEELERCDDDNHKPLPFTRMPKCLPLPKPKPNDAA
jgi:hypothetical protein